MATSGTWTYSVTALQVITSAAEDIGVIANGQSLDANDLATMLRTLNILSKQWMGMSDKFPGLKIWTRQRIAVFLALNQTRYLVGPASGDDRSAVLIGSSATASFNTTTTTAAKTASSTALVVGSTTGMTAADQIGIILATGALGWTTISSVTNSTTLVLSANTLGAANSGAVVFSYTSKAQRLIEVEAASLVDYYNNSQPTSMGLEIYTDVQQYEMLTQKNASGDPTAILIEPQRLNTAITCNFAAANPYKLLRLTAIFPSENYDNAAGSDDIAFPQEYFGALEWELARRCAAKFGKTWTADLASHWQIAVTEGVNLNPQDTHLCFEPGRDDADVGSPFTRP